MEKFKNPEVAEAFENYPAPMRKKFYGDILRFEGSRAIVFSKEDKIPVKAVKHCILLTLTYHKQKHLLAKMII